MNQFNTLLRWLPALAIVFGLISRVGSEATWLIQPSLMIIMLNTFVHSGASVWNNVKKSHAYLLLGQISMAIIGYLILRPFSIEMAAAGLVLALTPTAVAAGAIATGLRLNIAHVMSVIVVSNLAACFTLSIIPSVIGSDTYSFASTSEPFKVVGMTVLIPFLLSKLFLRSDRLIRMWKTGSYSTLAIRLLWAAILGVSASKVGVWYFENAQSDIWDLVWPLMMGIGTFGLFAALAYAVSRENKMESMIAFSHKNNGIALLLIIHTFPMSAVAVILSYSLMQNVFFSFLIGGKS